MGTASEPECREPKETASPPAAAATDLAVFVMLLLFGGTEAKAKSRKAEAGTTSIGSTEEEEGTVKRGGAPREAAEAQEAIINPDEAEESGREGMDEG